MSKIRLAFCLGVRFCRKHGGTFNVWAFVTHRAPLGQYSNSSNLRIYKLFNRIGRPDFMQLAGHVLKGVLNLPRNTLISDRTFVVRAVIHEGGS